MARHMAQNVQQRKTSSHCEVNGVDNYGCCTNLRAKNDPEDKKYSVEEIVEHIGFGKYQVLLLIVTGFSWMADSMEMMILAILGPVSRCEWILEPWNEALLSTVVFLGMFVSSALWGKLCDQYGRKSGIVLSSAWITYFGILSSFSPSYNWILLLRFLVGVGISGLSQVVVLYAEFVPGAYRAVTILALGAFWAIGGMLEVLLAIAVMPSHGWRWLLALSSLPLVVFLILSLGIPESPRYHVGAGEIHKGFRTLASVAETNKRQLPAGSGEFLKSTVSHDRGQIIDLFTNSYWRTTILVWIQMMGGLLIYYGILLMTPEIFQARRASKCDRGVLPGHHPKYTAGCGCKSLEREDYYGLLWTSLADLPGLLLVLFFIDRVGRIKTLMAGFALTSLFLVLLMFCNGRTMTTFYIFGVRYFATGATQVLYIYIPEVYPTNIRGLGLGMASAMARIGCIVTPFLAQVLVKISLTLTLLVYASCAFVCAVAALLLPIETNGMEMKDTNFATE